MPKLSTLRQHPNDIVRAARPIEDVRASIHAHGAQRHKENWLPCNIRAVDAARENGLDPTRSPAREAIPKIVMRLLDGLKVQAGLTWDKATEAWVPVKKE